MPEPVTNGPEWDETAYLMQSPANAERLRRATQDVREDKNHIRPTTNHWAALADAVINEDEEAADAAMEAICRTSVWSFDLTGTRDLTLEELDRLDNDPEFGDGHLTPEYGGGTPVTFHCDYIAETREEAVQAATDAIRRLGYDGELTVG
ncbi:hypothetical protein [Streptomyces albogriseolus]|uniref:hypothetical protein n=1 Tax=Streptomyces albogriseolus TaxID=1887 RepID=UPI003460BC18